MGGGELYDSTERDEALLHDVRLTVKSDNVNFRKRVRFPAIVDAECV